MIHVEITRSKRDADIVSFTAKNHGDSFVCSAVSMLVLNTVNSIEALTDQLFECDYNQDGGFLSFALAGPPEPGAKILLEAMAIGLKSTQSEYPDEIELNEIEPRIM